jgi:hypothetical protein
LLLILHAAPAFLRLKPGGRIRGNAGRDRTTPVKAATPTACHAAGACRRPGGFIRVPPTHRPLVDAPEQALHRLPLCSGVHPCRGSDRPCSRESRTVPRAIGRSRVFAVFTSSPRRVTNLAIRVIAASALLDWQQMTKPSAWLTTWASRWSPWPWLCQASRKRRRCGWPAAACPDGGRAPDYANLRRSPLRPSRFSGLNRSRVDDCRHRSCQPLLDDVRKTPMPA